MHIGKDVTADPEAVYSEKSRLIGSGPANLQELDRVRIDELSQITPWRMYAVSAQKVETREKVSHESLGN